MEENNESNKPIETEQIVVIQQLEEKVTCVNNHSFLAKNVKLLPFTNTNSDLGDIVFVNCDFRIISGCTEVVKSGFLLACPVCNLIHFSGFNKTPDEADIVDGEDNTLPIRTLTPEL